MSLAADFLQKLPSAGSASAWNDEEVPGAERFSIKLDRGATPSLRPPDGRI
jgi:hypothetical protein